MSLINQMLCDLDERQASALERGGLAAQVRALPREKRVPWGPALVVLAGMSLGAVGLWAWFESQAWRHAAPASMPVVTMPALPALVVPMPTEPPAAEPAKPIAAESLQMDFKLTQVPSRAEPAPASAPATVIASAPPAAQIDMRPLVQPTDTVDGEYRKAMAAYRQGRPNEAADGFRVALRLDGRHVSARQALLSLLLEQRRLPEAQMVAAEGLALVPAQPGWAMILARLQVEQGQAVEAEKTMAAYSAHGERSADYLAFHGLLLEKLRRPEEARVAFRRASELGTLPPDVAAAIEQRLR